MRFKRKTAFLGWAVFAPLILGAFATPPFIVLPDLQTLPPQDLRLIAIPQNHGSRILMRFTNSIWNAGPGSLELVGEPDPKGARIAVKQVIQDANGPREERSVGEFLFHPEHRHWHLDGFSLYEVWSLTPEGTLAQRLASSGKVSYCLMDITYHRPGIASGPVPVPHYGAGCGQRLQGISPGWVDTYKSNLADQWVDITGLEDGPYALASTVNPSGLLAETNLANNAGITYFLLSKLRIPVYGDTLRDIGIFPERINRKDWREIRTTDEPR